MKGVRVNNTLVRHAVFLAADTLPRVLMPLSKPRLTKEVVVSDTDYYTRLTKEVALDLVGLLCGLLPEVVMDRQHRTIILVQ